MSMISASVIPARVQAKLTINQPGAKYQMIKDNLLFNSIWPCK
jgi:hypothetical protein